MHRIEYNVTTGEQNIISLTEEEILEIHSCSQIEAEEVPLVELVPTAETVAEPKPPTQVKPKAKKKRVRARTSEGQFISDDPATPEVDEAWIEVEDTGTE
jgi:hypothetical protein